MTVTEEVRKKFEEYIEQILNLFGLVDQIAPCDGRDKAITPEERAKLTEIVEAAYQLGVEAMREAAAELLEALANQWVGTLPSDEVASLNCKQYAKAIRKLKG